MNRLLNNDHENHERSVLRRLDGDAAVGDALQRAFDRNRLQFQPNNYMEEL